MFDGWSIKSIESLYSTQQLPDYLCILENLPTNQNLNGDDKKEMVYCAFHILSFMCVQKAHSHNQDLTLYHDLWLVI